MPTRSSRTRPRAETPLVELTIERLGALGDGIGLNQGEPVFVPFTLPGERVRARLIGRRGDGVAASLIEVLTAASGRRQPACRHHGRCGGCAAQHLDRDLYLDWKRRIVADALARRGLDKSVVEAPVSVPPASRRRAEFTVVGRKEGPVVGFAERGSHRIVDIAECPVLRPELAALPAALRQAFAGWLEPGTAAEAMATLAEPGVDLLLTLQSEPDLALRERLAALAHELDLARLSWRRGHDSAEPIAIRRPVGIRFAGVWVELPPGAFLQATEEGETQIRDAALHFAGPAAHVADLYAGAGTLSLPLAQKARVHAVEGDPVLAHALERAASGLVGRLSVEIRDLEQNPLGPSELDRFDCVVFDPPRAGALATARALKDSAVTRVVAVSCHPGSFARDARHLVDGGYRLVRVKPIDQFLWSHHVELVGLFER